MNQPEEHLKRAISRLPEYEPSPDAWPRIEAELNFEQTLSHHLGQLPEYDPAPDGWEKISAGMAQSHPGKTSWVVTLRIAASVCLLLAAWAVGSRLHSKEETVRVMYSQETMVEQEPAFGSKPDQAQSEAYTFIEAHCRHELAVCQSPQFHELKAQLDELDAQASKLQRELNRYGEDNDLIRAQVKVENLKAEITKELIELLTS